MVVRHVDGPACAAPVGFQPIELHFDNDDTEWSSRTADAAGDVETRTLADAAEGELLRRSLFHSATEIVAEGVVIADETERFAPIARRDGYSVRADDIKHGGLRAGDEPLELAVQDFGCVAVCGRQRVENLLVLRQEKRQGTGALQHSSQQCDLQIGVGAALAFERFDGGSTAVEFGAHKRRRNQDRGHGKEQDPGTPRLPVDVLRRSA